MSAIANAGVPYGSDSSTCGYCSPPGERSKLATSIHEASLDAIILECKTYQAMIDRGWRRSGTFCYKPEMRTTCCPQYTIKLDAEGFKPARSHRQLINRWNRFVLQGEPEQSTEQDNEPNQPKPKKKKEAKGPAFTTLANALHSSEHSFLPDGEKSVHKFEVELEKASYTKEKFNLYQKYQLDIHKEKKDSPNSFTRFLVDSPLISEEIPYGSTPPPPHLPTEYGSYHQLYRIDGELIALAVIDILPKCVSSVYFMYDVKWERFSLGKLSALREVCLAQELKEAGAPEMEALYMGYYVYSCPKMRYKGEYSPSFLLDPEQYDWHPLENCIPLLDKNRYACFANASHSVSLDTKTSRLKRKEEPIPPLSLFEDVNIILQDSGNLVIVPLQQTNCTRIPEAMMRLGSCLKALGPDLSKVVSFSFSMI